MNQSNLTKIETSILDTDLYKVSASDLLDETYIFTDTKALEIQLSPWLTSNSGLGTFALKSSEKFLKIFFEQHKKELASIDPESFCDLIPLSGSLYYHISDAFYNVFQRALPQVFIGVRRNFRDNQWVADISYRNIDSLPEKPFLIIGDTIATGSTLFAILHEIKKQVDEIQGIAIFSLAGARPGIQLLHKMEKIFGSETKIFVYQANAIFGLLPNGTDMPWIHPDTITTTELLQKAIDRYGSYLAERWCTIWDWGNRCNSSSRHLEDFIETIERYLEQVEDTETKEKLQYFLEKAQFEKNKISSSFL